MNLCRALAGAVVRVVGGDHQGVRAVVKRKLAPRGLAVERGLEAGRDQVEVGGARLGLEGHGAHGSELVGAGDVHGDVVVDVGDQLRALLRVLACQIGLHVP